MSAVLITNGLPWVTAQNVDLEAVNTYRSFLKNDFSRADD